LVSQRLIEATSNFGVAADADWARMTGTPMMPSIAKLSVFPTFSPSTTRFFVIIPIIL
jgi:hypothetical protein